MISTRRIMMCEHGERYPVADACLLAGWEVDPLNGMRLSRRGIVHCLQGETN